MKLPIYALVPTPFAMGTAGFAPNGQLLSASADLSVSVADSGLIATGFALGRRSGDRSLPRPHFGAGTSA